MEEKMSMINPKIEDLLDHSENKFTLVIESAKRSQADYEFPEKTGRRLGWRSPHETR